MTVFRTLLALAFLSACSGSNAVGTPDAGAQPVTIAVKGLVQGGVSPIVGASVQLYSANTLSGTASTALATATTSDATGAFSFTGVTCPANAFIYVLATGGAATGTAANPNLALMTALGTCGSFVGNVIVNEVTTVAAASSLSHFMLSPTALSGSDATLSAAFAASALLVNPAAGSSPGLNVPQGQSVPTSLINTLANILATCVQSGGGSAGDVPQSSCGLLFSATTADATRLPTAPAVPNNTINAVINIANNSLLRIPPVFALLQPAGPFQPQLGAQPSSLLLQVSSTSGLLISHSDLSFVQTTAGTTGADIEQVTLTNSGAAAVSLNSFTLGGSFPASFKIVSNNCGLSLAVAASCTVSLSFTPQIAGQLSAVFTAQTAAGDLSVNLSGIGL